MPDSMLWLAISIATFGVVAARALPPRAVSVAASAAAALITFWSALGGTHTVEFGLLAVSPLNEAALVLFPLLCSATMLAAPKRDMTPAMAGGSLTILAGTLLSYASVSPLLLLAGWVVSALPFLIGPFTVEGNWRPRVALSLSCVMLAAALQLPQLPYLIVAAIVLRKGIFPAHAWFDESAEHGPLLPGALLFAAHMGVLLRLRTTSLDDVLLSNLALCTAAYTAVRAVREIRPRRVLALISLSQAACLLAGIESGTAIGSAGAMLHWIVVSVASTGLFLALRLAEVRFGESLNADSFHGIGEHAPRLAVMFAVCGLALVGLPGTLGFISEDLLVHGTLESHSVLSVLLPVATAFNAVSILRLFAHLFLGRLRRQPSGVTDLLVRERLALSALVVTLVAAGIWPKPIVEMQQRAYESAAKRIAVHR